MDFASIPPEMLVPHRSPVLFLERVIERSAGEIRCFVRVPGSGAIPVGAAIECMAQAAAAHGGIACPGAPKRGMLAAVRSFEASGPRFEAGVSHIATCSLDSESGGASLFDCSLSDADGRDIAAARILISFLGEG